MGGPNDGDNPRLRAFKDAKGQNVWLEEESLFLFRRKNFLRTACVYVSSHWIFEFLSLVAIAANSVTLAAYDYRDRDDQSPKNKLLSTFSDAFTWIFLVEALIKIIAKGLWMAPNSYLREFGNAFDFVIVMSGIFEYAMKNNTDSSLDWIKTLRVLRVSRPLKSISAMPSLKN